MQKHAARNFRTPPLGEAAFAASRKFWLAGIGATVVTRDWVGNEGPHLFRTLVRQGTVVEARTIRFLGDTVETSFTRANTIWGRTRRTMEANVKKAAASVVDYAQQVLPKSLPRFELPKAFAPAAKAKAPVKRARKTAKSRAARGARKAKRTTKRA